MSGRADLQCVCVCLCIFCCSGKKNMGDSVVVVLKMSDILYQLMWNSKTCSCWYDQKKGKEAGN